MSAFPDKPITLQPTMKGDDFVLGFKGCLALFSVD
jgi:hypothetical protein